MTTDNKCVNIINLLTGQDEATYVNIDPKMALFSYVQGLKGMHNTWEYSELIKNANFTEGKYSIGLDDYAVVKTS